MIIVMPGRSASPIQAPDRTFSIRELSDFRHAWLREQPFWRDVLVLCSDAAPAGQLDRLRRHRVGHVVLGEGRVDLGGALRLLAEQHRVGAVRVDAGGGLNGALLRAGLADQLSIVILPGGQRHSRPGAPAHRTGGCRDAVALDLTAVEHLRQGHVWLRYDVRKGPDPGLSRVDPAAKSGFPGGLVARSACLSHLAGHLVDAPRSGSRSRREACSGLMRAPPRYCQCAGSAGRPAVPAGARARPRSRSGTRTRRSAGRPASRAAGSRRTARTRPRSSPRW